MKVRGTSFEFRRDEFKDYLFDEGTRFGFIAQELEEVFPEVVKTEDNGYKSVNYDGMIPVLLEAIKEQQKGIEQIKAENNQLKAEMILMRTEYASLLSKLGKFLEATIDK